MFKDTKKNIKIKEGFEKIKLPKKGHDLFFLELNGKSIFDVIYSIYENEEVLDLQIVAYRISTADLRTLEEMRKTKKWNFKIKLLLSGSIPRMVKGTYNYVCENPNFEVKYLETHEKNAFIKTNENSYFVTSSGNFNPKLKIETLAVFNSEEIYNNLKPFQNE